MKHGTNFRDRVYRIVREIPCGKTMSYKEIARRIGFPRAWRAVGNILAKNQNTFNCKAITRRSGATTGLKIPCHRVTRSDGKIGGYNFGTRKKIYLLKKEGVKLDKYGKITSRFNK